MLENNGNKIFVLDTNIVLYDYRSIFSFEEHNVVIPITLLEEVDRFKRGNEIINYNAREFSRELDGLIGEGFTKDGVRLKNGGHILVRTNIQKDSYMKEIFWEDSPDHRILTVAYNLSREYGKERVVLVSKDINLRMKAKSIDIKAEDYETGKIQNIDELYKGKNLVEGIDHDVIDRIYKEGVSASGSIRSSRGTTPQRIFYPAKYQPVYIGHLREIFKGTAYC